MLIWGSHGKTVEAGDAGVRACPVCKENRHFRYVLTYKVRHIWYLVRWASGKSYSTVCSVCNCVFPSDPPVIEDAGISGGQKPKNPIPVFDRWGWAMALGAIALFLGFAVVAGNADKAKEAKMAAAPAIGDLYTVDVGKFIGPDPAAPLRKEYGIFRVASVSGDKVVLDVPKMVTNKMSGTYSEISSGKVRDASYYDGQMQTTVSGVVAAQKDGAIRGIDR